jgi:SulP family sulfate permease
MKGVRTPAPSDGSLTEEERRALEGFEQKILIIALHGWFSYASARELIRRIGTMTAGYRAVVFDMSEAERFDTSAALAIEELILGVQAEGSVCIISGLSGGADTALRALRVVNKVEPANIVPTKLDAIRRATALLRP